MLAQLNSPGYTELKRQMYYSDILEQVCYDIISSDLTPCRSRAAYIQN